MIAIFQTLCVLSKLTGRGSSLELTDLVSNAETGSVLPAWENGGAGDYDIFPPGEWMTSRA